MRGLVSVVLFLFVVSIASAHVTVKPTEVGVASYQTFTVGVPVEKDIPTVSVRVVLPEGLESVTPYVKNGWKIAATGTEIIWSGGSIPAGQRDDFLFSAKAPSKEGHLIWKAYQTYSDGSVVAWDNAPAGGHDAMDADALNPYSETHVVDDLGHKGGLNLSVVALALSVLALGLSLRKR